MQTLTLLLATVAVAFSAPLFDEQFISLWSTFKATHGKSYTTEEDAVRADLFHKRVMMINEHNLRYEAGLESSQVEINYLADWTDAEIVGRNGYRVNDPDPRMPCVASKVDDADIPKSWNWADKGAVTPVKDQGQCGSCWAFGTTGSLEGAWFLKYNQLVSLSEQNLVDCDKEWDMGCKGGLPEVAFKYVNKNGLNGEDDYKYHAVGGECKFDANAVKANLTGCEKIKQGDEEGLKKAVAKKGPVAIGMDASHFSFQFYKAGQVYKESRCRNCDRCLDHAVLVVGYDTTPDGQDYWIIKNSWGNHWGDKGYIWIARNANNTCGVATDAVYPIV